MAAAVAAPPRVGQIRSLASKVRSLLFHASRSTDLQSWPSASELSDWAEFPNNHTVLIVTYSLKYRWVAACIQGRVESASQHQDKQGQSEQTARQPETRAEIKLRRMDGRKTVVWWIAVELAVARREQRQQMNLVTQSTQ